MANRWWTSMRGSLVPGFRPPPSPGTNGGRGGTIIPKRNVDPFPKVPGKTGQWWKPLAFGREIEAYPVAEGVDGPGRARKSPGKRKLEQAFREVNRNEPDIVAKTRRKKGAAAARKQKVAIAFSKARRRGARA